MSVLALVAFVGLREHDLWPAILSYLPLQILELIANGAATARLVAHDGGDALLDLEVAVFRPGGAKPLLQDVPRLDRVAQMRQRRQLPLRRLHGQRKTQLWHIAMPCL